MFTKYINEIKVIFQNRYAQVLMVIFSIIFGLVKSLSEFIYDKDEINVDIQQGGGICSNLLSLVEFCLLDYNA